MVVFYDSEISTLALQASKRQCWFVLFDCASSILSFSGLTSGNLPKIKILFNNRGIPNYAIHLMADHTSWTQHAFSVVKYGTLILG